MCLEMSVAPCIFGIETEIKSFRLFFFLSGRIFAFLASHNATSSPGLVRRIQMEKFGKCMGQSTFYSNSVPAALAGDN